MRLNVTSEEMSRTFFLSLTKWENRNNSTTSMMQSYPARALDRKLQVDWARDAREGPRVLMSLRVDFRPMG